MWLLVNLLLHLLTDDSVFENKSFQESLIENKDAGVEETDLMEDKEVGKGSRDDNEEEKTSAVKDADFVMQLLGQTQ